MAISDNRRTHPLYGIDILRGIVVLLLALGACRPQRNAYSLWYAPAFPLLARTIDQGLIQGGIYLFFILGGFLITRSLMQCAAGGTSPRAFFVRRALRILPAYGFVVFFVAVISAISAAGMKQFWNVVSLATFTSNFAILISGQRPQDALHGGVFWLGPLWPISLYVQLCVVWGCFFRIIRRPESLVELVLLGLALVWFLFYPPDNAVGLDAWALGGCIALGVEGCEPGCLRRIFAISTALGAALLAITLLKGSADKWPEAAAMDLFWGGIVGLCAISRPFNTGKSTLAALGRHGYGFCLIQIAIAMPIATLWQKHGHAWFGLDVGDLDQWCFAVTLGMSLSASTMLAVLLRRFWEKRWLGRADKYVSEPSSIAGECVNKPFRPAIRSGLTVRSTVADRTFLLCGVLVCILLYLGWGMYRHLDAKLGPSLKIEPDHVVGIFTPDGVNKYHWYWNEWAKTDAQTHTHQALCIALALLTLVAVAWRRQLAILNRRLVIGLAIVGGLLCLPFVYSCRADFILGGGAGFVIIVVLGGALFRRIRFFNPLCTLAAVGLLIALMMPAFFHAADFSELSWPFLGYTISHHYNGVLSDGERLAHGQHLFKQVIPMYGAALPLLTAALDLWWRPLSIGDYVTYIKVLQAIYVFAAAYCYYRVCGRHKLIFLLTALLAAYNYHYNNPAWQWYPNHSAARHIGMPLGILLMILMRKRSLPAGAMMLGFGSGCALLLNAEVGTAVTVGLGAYVFLQFFSRGTHRSAKLFFALPAIFMVGVIGAMLIYIVAYRAVLGYWVEAQYVPAVFEYINTTRQTGYSSMRAVPFSAIAVLMFAHAATALLFSAFARGRQTGPRNSLRGAVAAMIVVWFAYWANRPDHEYLYSYWIPYGILLIDTLRTIAGIRRYHISAVGVTSAAALLFVIGPWIYTDVGQAIGQYFHAPYSFNTRVEPAVELSGIWLHRDARTAFIQQKADYIKSLPASPPPIYLSVDTFFIAHLSNVWPDIAVFDPYAGAITRQDYDRLLNSIRDSKNEYIYIDSESSLPDGVLVGELAYYRALRGDLGRYFELKDTVNGWERWRRRPKLPSMDTTTN